MLRRGKSEAALLIALADIGGVWPVDAGNARVDGVCRRGRRCGDPLSAARRGRAAASSIRPTREDPEEGRLHRARHGQDGRVRAQLLERYRPHRPLRPRQRPRSPTVPKPASLYVRLTRGLVKAAAGAHRRRLRVPHRSAPAPRSGLDPGRDLHRCSALNYYEQHRAELGARCDDQGAPCAGDIAAGEAFLKKLAPFIWRKYLDYAAVADVHAMKRQIARLQGHAEIAVEGHNIKLGRGGIREIEFFVQTQQLIAGGRHPELRGRETLADAGGRLRAAAGSAEEARARSRRGLPVPARGRAPFADGRRRPDPHPAARARGAAKRFARFLGFADRDAFAAALLGHACARCSAIMRSCSRMRPPPRRRAANSSSPDADEHRDARQARRDGIPRGPSRCRTRCGDGSRANTGR